MVVEKQIESKVITKLTEAFSQVSGISIVGSWQSTNVGEVKGMEDFVGKGKVSVATGAPEYENWTMPIANVPVAIGLTVRQELAPTAAELETFMSVIEDVLVGWQLQAGGISDLTTVNFRADGVRLDAGDPPQFSTAKSVWTIARGLTVRGAIIQTQE